MKSFLLNSANKPTIPWGGLRDEVYFSGEIPENHSLAVSPGNSNIVILDVDVKNGKNGFLNIPSELLLELNKTFNYGTKSGGQHIFIYYTGNKTLMNRATKFGLDLRIGSKNGNAGGYVRYYHIKPIQDCIHLIKPSSIELNKFLEELFSNNNGKEI